MKDLLLEKAKSLFGDDFQQFCSDESFAIRCLQDRDPQKRVIALVYLCYRTEVELDLKISLCRNRILNDNNDSVALNAIGSLGRLQSGTFDDRTSKLLAKFALDSSKSSKSRCAAYYAIEKIRTHASSFIGSEGVMDRVDRIKRQFARIRDDARRRRTPNLDEIDWELIHSLAK